MDRIFPQRPPASWLVHLGFILLVVLVGAAIGMTARPGAWYEGLVKPPFNPPSAVFGPVWFALYVLIGWAGARIFLRAPRSAAMALWGAQMGLNWLWSPVWFGLEMIWPAFAVIVLMWASIAGFILFAWRVDKVSAWLFAPYLAWVSFAGLLNAAIGVLN